MADPDAENDDDDVEEPQDYYSILNVRKEANSEEIRDAYRKMCLMYHPDKHTHPNHKATAERIFNKVHKAHDVLSNEKTRMIYDTYGQKGLDAGQELVERKKTPQELLEEYERLQREAEERRIQQRTNPAGSFTMKINATELFDNYDYDPYYDDERSWLPTFEIKGMTLNQSIEAPLTKNNTAVLSGNLQHEKGNGSGSVHCCFRKVISPKSWGELDVGAGEGPSLRVKGYRTITDKMFATVSVNSAVKSTVGFHSGLQGMLARQLTKNTMGYMSWAFGGPMSILTTTLARDTQHYHAMAQVQLQAPNVLGILSYTHKFENESQVKFSLKLGLLGAVFNYGFDHKVTSLSRVAAFVSIGQNSGVTLKVRVQRHTQSFNFPILLSEFISPQAIFYGTFLPLVTYWCVKALIVSPFLDSEKEKNLQENREKYADHIAQKRKEAEATNRLMQDLYKLTVDRETEKHGLIITEAWYGQLVSVADRFSGTASVINVVVPLQCMVKDSKLLLTDSTKSQLNGFYDPCIGEEKTLKIVYEFRGAVHEATFSDTEQVRIPKQSHVISSRVS